METKHFLSVSGTNVSQVWAKAFVELADSGAAEAIPLTMEMSGFGESPREIGKVRSLLDATLRAASMNSCRTVANTIFPDSLWNRSTPREKLFERYKRLLPRLKNHKGNHNGLYFERMIAFGSSKKNQLDHLISTRLGGNRRRSALELVIFDPERDHTNQRRRGFPCLQQIAFSPYGNGRLGVLAFYPMLYLFDRAYGDLLGLCALADFVAHELKLTFSMLTCVAGIATFGTVTSGQATRLSDELKKILSSGS